MSKFKIPFSVILFLLLLNILEANVLLVNDVESLSKEDKKIFFEKCISKNKYIESLKCINFLGIRIFLTAYHDTNVESDEFKEKEYIAIKYLKFASERGYKMASANLGWIFSNKKSNYYDLEKSSQYFELVQIQKNEINTIDQYSNLNDKNSEFTNKNQSKLEEVIYLKVKINIYHSLNNTTQTYLSKRDHAKANIFFEKILEKFNVSKENIILLEKKFTSHNQIELSRLNKKSQISAEAIRNQAIKDLQELIKIYKN